MKVLFVSWELDPIFKVGGLGDVARSLPRVLKDLGVDIRIIMPFYKKVKLGRLLKTKRVSFKIEYGGKKEKVDIIEVSHPSSKAPVYLVKNKQYLDIVQRGETFVFFDKVVAEILYKDYLHWLPDIVHCNDHHTGLIPLFIKEYKLPIKTLLTIHNLEHQGITAISTVLKLALGRSKFISLAWDKSASYVNFLMEAIIHVDIINTVSPTYAKEIKTPEFGEKLDEVLRGKEGRLFGILNGIEIEEEKLKHFKEVKYPYLQPQSMVTKKKRVYGWEEGKRLNKKYLQKNLGLAVTESIPLLSFIGRLAGDQKGLDILYQMLKNIEKFSFQLVILGTGSKDWEDKLSWLSKFYPKNISCILRFDQPIAAQIYASSDFILVPSKFEPCGLVQMIGMLCGTIPIAHKTGGLMDSIKDGENGFLFDSYSSVTLRNSLDKAVKIWKYKKSVYNKLVDEAFKTDLSWSKSARQYLELYYKLVRGGY